MAKTHPTVREAYLQGVEHLRAAGSAEPAIEAEVLLRHVLQWNRAVLYTRWETSIEPGPFSRYQGLLETRATGRPVHYILGEREFMGLTFTVDERVMIPRPETETLVEFVIETLKKPAGVGNRKPCRDNLANESGLPTPDSCLLVDVGTGSGCIAVSLAHYLPHSRVYATDISAAALEMAIENARRHEVEHRVVFVEGDLLTPLPRHLQGAVDVIVSNPPYVAASDAPMLARDIREFEPAVAVFAPAEGTAIHARLIEQAPDWLGPGGLLAMEVGSGQADSVREMLCRDARYGQVAVIADLAGTGRVVAAHCRQSPESTESTVSTESTEG